MIRSLPLSALLAASTALGAHADVTPEDVWANYAATYGAIGLEIATQTRRDGDRLIVEAPRATAQLPFGIGSVEVTMGDLYFTDAGDGTVLLDEAQPFPFAISADLTVEGESAAFRIGFLAETENAEIRASGSPGDVTYATRYDSLTITVADIAFSGAPELEAMTASGTLTLGATESETRIRQGDLLQITSTGSVASGSTDFLIEIPGGLDSVTAELTGTNGPSQTTATLALPSQGTDLLNLSAALRDGLSIRVDSTSEGTESRTVTRAGDVILSDQRQSAARATQSLRFDEAGLAVSGTTDEITLDIPSDMTLPFPVSLRAASASGEFRIPVNASEAPQTAQIAMDLSGFEMSEDLWSLFDPRSLLPRDPARIAFDLSSDLTVMSDLLDINGLSELAMMNLVPVEATSVSLSSLDIDMVGATLSGSGAFTLDNSDMQTFPGMPRPEGGASFEASGLNALIDNLIALGALTQEDALGARMGMGLFLTPTGEDAFSSTVEIDGSGGVFVNGQRLR